ncbi:MAG: hypothetical protein M3Q71_24590 [Chloroflexota bacterium]|nr:hypothetical protein [Chloroflexota bacterium]
MGWLGVLDVLDCAPTFGTTLDPVVGIAASGRTPCVRDEIDHASSQGGDMGLAGSVCSPLDPSAASMIAPLVGRVGISRSTRPKADTA